MVYENHTMKTVNKKRITKQLLQQQNLETAFDNLLQEHTLHLLHDLKKSYKQ